MAVESPRESQLKGATALLDHLRTNPGEARRPANELAVRFGLSAGFVESVVENASVNSAAVDPILRKKVSFDFARHGFDWVGRLILRAFSKPILFVAITNILCVLGIIGTDRLIPDSAKIAQYVPADALAILFQFLFLVLAHLACYFHLRTAKAALQGAVVVWAMGSLGVAASIMLSEGIKSLGERALYAALSSMGILFVTLGYLCAGVIASVLGGWAHARKQERREASMSRQELLERYFELQERLSRGSTQKQVGNWLEQSPTAKFFRKSPMAFSVIGTVLLSLTGALIMRSLPITDAQEARTSVPALIGMVVGFVLLCLRGVLHVGAGIFSRSIGHALLVSAAMCAGSFAMGFLPIRQAVDNPFSFSQISATLVQLLVGGLVSGFAALGAELQRKAAREESLDNNDGATLLAEMLRIQWRLADRTNSTCILVVDAAKSSQMKANADPLIVEYSFREYQDWLGKVCAQFEGKVHSTAGDGAVVAFPSCDKAFLAARRIQTDVARFNANVNRLAMPFRLRIGLHVGQVAGAVDDVQFTEVIDIAAHIESVATVGGIAVSEPVTLGLPQYEFLPLAREVDGQRVYLALSPTEEG